jgi:hypothetical protein
MSSLAPRRRRTQSVEDPQAEVAEVTQIEATMAVAKALERIADGFDALKPAAETIHGFGDRADALCRWLRGKWPWLGLLASTVLVRMINVAPAEAPKLIEALTGLIKVFTG